MAKNNNKAEKLRAESDARKATEEARDPRHVQITREAASQGLTPEELAAKRGFTTVKDLIIDRHGKKGAATQADKDAAKRAAKLVQREETWAGKLWNSIPKISWRGRIGKGKKPAPAARAESLDVAEAEARTQSDPDIIPENNPVKDMVPELLEICTFRLINKPKGSGKIGRVLMLIGFAEGTNDAKIEGVVEALESKSWGQ